MRKLEQMTINDVYNTVTLGDIALYGGLVAIGFVIAVILVLRFADRFK